MSQIAFPLRRRCLVAKGFADDPQASAGSVRGHGDARVGTIIVISCNEWSTLVRPRIVTQSGNSASVVAFRGFCVHCESERHVICGIGVGGYLQISAAASPTLIDRTFLLRAKPKGIRWLSEGTRDASLA